MASAAFMPQRYEKYMNNETQSDLKTPTVFPDTAPGLQQVMTPEKWANDFAIERLGIISGFIVSLSNTAYSGIGTVYWRVVAIEVRPLRNALHLN